MSLHVMATDERELIPGREGDGFSHAHLEAERQPRTHGHRDRGQILRADRGTAEGLLHRGIDGGLVRLLSQLRDHPAPALVHAGLRGQHLSEDRTISPYHRCASVVAARLDAQHEPLFRVAGWQKTQSRCGGTRRRRRRCSAGGPLCGRLYFVGWHGRRRRRQRPERHIDTARRLPCIQNARPALAYSTEVDASAARLGPDATQCELEAWWMGGANELGA